MAIAPADHIAGSRAASERLRQVIAALPGPHVTAGYWPIRGEMNILPALSLPGCITVLPRVDHAFHPLVFHRWKPGDPLVRSRYAIDEPDIAAPIFIPDIVIVPLLAFDRSGHRLGYGRGYYDVTLAHLRTVVPRLLAIGAAFSLQETAELTPDAHDERLDWVVTEKETLDMRLKT